MEQFRNHGTPIEDLLHEEMRWVAKQPEHGEAFIIEPKKSPKNGLNDYTILEQRKELTQKQLNQISKLIHDPRSYSVTGPLWRRHPPSAIKFTFAIRLFREQQFLDIFLSLGNNSGWAFFHNSGHYMCRWNWISSEMRQLAHEIFPEYAAKSPDSAWRKGTIKELSDKLRQKTNNK